MLHVNVVVSQSQGREITQLPLFFSPPLLPFCFRVWKKKENCWGGRGPAIDGSDGSTFLTLTFGFFFSLYSALNFLLSLLIVCGEVACATKLGFQIGTV